MKIKNLKIVISKKLNLKSFQYLLGRFFLKDIIFCFFADKFEMNNVYCILKLHNMFSDCIVFYLFYNNLMNKTWDMRLWLKIITARDPHWNDDYKKINPDDADLVFFQWDYVDVHEKYMKDQLWDYYHLPYSQEEQEWFDIQIPSVLEWILEMKYKYGEKIILLLWNHDAQYIRPIQTFECYRQQLHDVLHTIYHQHINQFTFVHRIENVLFSHGWITNEFAKYYQNKTIHHITETRYHIKPKDTCGYSSNDTWRTNLNNPLLYRSAYKTMWHDEFPNWIPNWPLWTKWSEILNSPLTDMIQIFWHHHRPNSLPIINEKTNTKLYCVDSHYPQPIHEIFL